MLQKDAQHGSFDHSIVEFSYFVLQNNVGRGSFDFPRVEFLNNIFSEYWHIKSEYFKKYYPSNFQLINKNKIYLLLVNNNLVKMLLKKLKS